MTRTLPGKQIDNRNMRHYSVLIPQRSKIIRCFSELLSFLQFISTPLHRFCLKLFAIKAHEFFIDIRNMANVTIYNIVSRQHVFFINFFSGMSQSNDGSSKYCVGCVLCCGLCVSYINDMCVSYVYFRLPCCK